MKDMVAFTSEVMNHCHLEAKHSTDIVMGALSYLASNTKGIEIKELECEFKASQLDEQHHHAVIHKVTDSINAFSEQDTKRQQLMAPIVQQLQFQDYVSQQMDVLIKMLTVWLEKRKDLVNGEISQSVVDDFGNELVALCVSEPEKEVIKRYIPNVTVALPIEDDDLFF